MSSRSSKRHKPDQSPLLELLHPSRFAPIRDNIFAYLDSVDLLRLKGTSPDLRDNVMSSVWDINRVLGHYFDDPLAFRSMLATCNALVTGPLLLAFTDNGTTGSSKWLDLDFSVVVRQGQKSEEFLSFVKLNAGWQVEW